MATAVAQKTTAKDYSNIYLSNGLFDEPDYSYEEIQDINFSDTEWLNYRVDYTLQ